MTLRGTLLALCLAAATPLWAQTARIAGTVKAKPRVETKGGGGGAYAAHDVGFAVKFDYARLRHVVVYAEPAEAKAAASPAKAPESSFTFALTRDGAVTIKPEFSATPRGAEVVLRNQTPNPLNVYAKGDPAPTMITLAAGASKSIRPQSVGPLVIGCLEEPQTQAKLLVAGPYFSVADDQGRYSLELPAGGYRVTAWHERLPPQTKDVRVRAGEQSAVDFVLSVLGLPEVP